MLAAIMNALFVIATKKALVKEHSIEFSSVISLLVFLFSMPLLFFLDFNISLGQLAWIYITASLFTIGFLYNMKAIKHMDVSVVAPLTTFNVAIISLLAVIFLGERLSLMQLLGIALLLVGCYILQTHHISTNLFAPLKKIVKSKSIAYLFAAMILFAFAFIIIRAVSNTNNAGAVDPYSYVFLLNLFMAINFFTIITLFYGGLKTYSIGFKSWKLILLPALFILMYRLLQLAALSIPEARLSLTLALNEIYVLFVVIIGGKMFHEHDLKRKMVGSIIMLAGVYIILISGA